MFTHIFLAYHHPSSIGYGDNIYLLVDQLFLTRNRFLIATRITWTSSGSQAIGRRFVSERCSATQWRSSQLGFFDLTLNSW